MESSEMLLKIAIESMAIKVQKGLATIGSIFVTEKKEGMTDEEIMRARYNEYGILLDKLIQEMKRNYETGYKQILEETIKKVKEGKETVT